MLWLLLSTLAHGSAYYFTDVGVRGMARGGAFIAGADDLTAQYYNPAALIRLREPQVMFNLAGVAQAVKFTRMDYDDQGELLQEYETVENIAKPMLVPTFGVAHHFGLRNTVFALGMYPPYAPDMEYPADGPQRYTLVDSLVWQINAGPSVAHRFAPWLTAGVGAAWVLFRTELIKTITTCADWDVCGADPDKYDLDVSLKAWDPARFNFNVGLLIEPTELIDIGLSVTPPIKMNATGEVAVDFSDQHVLTSDAAPILNGTHYEDKEVHVQVRMPLIARLGVAFHPRDDIEVEVAGVYEAWSMTDEIRVTDLNLVLERNPDSVFLAEDIPVNDDIVLPANYSDAWSIRVGGDIDIREPLTVRAGTFYEKSAIPLQTQSVGLVDGNKIGYGLGVSLRPFERISLDLAFAQSWLKKRDINNSLERQLVIPLNFEDIALNNEFNTGIETGQTVGNGTFSSHLTLFSGGLVWKFGKAPGDDS